MTKDKLKEILKTYKFNKKYLNEVNKESISNNLNIKLELTFISNFNKKVENCILSLPQPYKSILFYKFIKGISYDMIAIKLNYSVQRIYQLLNIALMKFEEQYSLLTVEHQKAV